MPQTGSAVAHDGVWRDCGGAASICLKCSAALLCFAGVRLVWRDHRAALLCSTFRVQGSAA